MGVVFLGVELAMSALASVPIEQRAGLESGMQALIDFKGPLPVVFLGLSLNLGLIVLSMGLFVARVVPRWTSVAIAVASLVLVGGLFSNPLGAGGDCSTAGWTRRRQPTSTQAYPVRRSSVARRPHFLSAWCETQSACKYWLYR